jgi:hypothetical protein
MLDIFARKDAAVILHSPAAVYHWICNLSGSRILYPTPSLRRILPILAKQVRQAHYATSFATLFFVVAHIRHVKRFRQVVDANPHRLYQFPKPTMHDSLCSQRRVSS